jgi:hypothetical protein
MGLAKDIENALWEGMTGQDGTEPPEEYGENGRGNIPEVSRKISKAIVDFLQKQKFTITKLKSAVELEEIKTAAPLSADVLPSVSTTSFVATAPGSGTGFVSSGTKGVRIPSINLRKRGSRQGGVLTARGYAYIGNNPISSREKRDKHKDNVVELLKIKKGTD